ncbi:hypothetical protein EV646_112168 [Kribbella antiqua]|uniref:Uncharacterized protein n=1 Tax=Kribbella antiqua TaxID=2512217 RepID=A0A4R2IFR8_9ACTN|nr:hypothetical protein EV646_112168 [Kribbella antiqua]
MLEERRNHPLVCVGPPASGSTEVTDAGVAGLVLQIVQRCGVTGPDRVLDRLAVLAPLHRFPLRLPHRTAVAVRRFTVTGAVRLGECTAGRLGGGAGLYLLGLERGVEHRHRLLRTERGVVERDVLAHRFASQCTQFGAPLRGCTGLLGQCIGVHLLLALVRPPGVTEGLGLVPPRRVAERLVARVDEPLVQRGHVLRVDLAGQPESFCTLAEPAPGRLAGRHGAGVVVLPTRGHGAGEIVGPVAAVHAQHEAPPNRAATGATAPMAAAGGRPIRRREAGSRLHLIVMPGCDLSSLVLLLPAGCCWIVGWVMLAAAASLSWLLAADRVFSVLVIGLCSFRVRGWWWSRRWCWARR